MPFDWTHDTGPINVVVPSDDEFWQDQPRDAQGRWAPKEKELEYAGLVREPKVWIKQYEQVPLDVMSIFVVEGNDSHSEFVTEDVTGGWRKRTYANGRIVFIRTPCKSEDDVIEQGDPLFRELIKLRPQIAPNPNRRPATPAAIRRWAQANDFVVSDRGKLPQNVIAAYHKANG
jgi:hypothetical protein